MAEHSLNLMNKKNNTDFFIAILGGKFIFLLKREMMYGWMVSKEIKNRDILDIIGILIF